VEDQAADLATAQVIHIQNQLEERTPAPTHISIPKLAELSIHSLCIIDH